MVLVRHERTKSRSKQISANTQAHQLTRSPLPEAESPQQILMLYRHSSPDNDLTVELRYAQSDLP